MFNTLLTFNIDADEYQKMQTAEIPKRWRKLA
jgi:hypothetical protein